MFELYVSAESVCLSVRLSVRPSVRLSVCLSVRLSVSPLRNEELNDLYCSPNIVRVIKWSKMRWAGHVARTRERRGYKGFWWENLRVRNHLEDPGVDGKII